MVRCVAHRRVRAALCASHACDRCHPQDGGAGGSAAEVPARRPRVLVLAGPTASGKTALSLALAHALDGEVVSADSVQARPARSGARSGSKAALPY